MYFQILVLSIKNEITESKKVKKLKVIGKNLIIDLKSAQKISLENYIFNFSD